MIEISYSWYIRFYPAVCDHTFIGFIFALNDNDYDFILGNNRMIARFLFIYSNVCKLP